MNKRLLRIILGGALFATGIVVFEIIGIDNLWFKLALYIATFTISGYDVVFNAIKNIFSGKVFDENFLMTLATAGAFAIGEYPEAAAVMIFYQIGELFQDYAVDKSRKSIAKLMNIRPDYAFVLVNGEPVRRSPDEVSIGDLILIKAGERIPLDAVVVSGNSAVDTSALTGESVPRDVQEGSTILSGCINLSGVLTAKVIKTFEQSTVSKILDLVENSAAKKSKSESFITQFARYYTPIVVVVAVLLAVLPPLFVPKFTFTDFAYRALTFLVVSCPCALVISVPMSFFGGIGGASRQGILVKGGNYLEALAKTKTVVFDKTGTLTLGVFKVQSISPVGLPSQELLEFAALAEHYSNHPIAISLREAYGKEIDESRISAHQEIAGLGISALIDSKRVLLGNNKLMSRENVEIDESPTEGSVVHLAIDNKYAGHIVIADQIKPDALKAIADLRAVNVEQTIMLTGDIALSGKSVGQALGIDKVYTELLPNDKVEKMQEIMSAGGKKSLAAFVGDGINDAPVLAIADVGIAMGGLGSDAAIEAADVVIMNDQPSKLATAKKIARKTVGIARQNTFFAIGVKVLVLALSAVGLANMWMAIFADVGVTLLATLNALRTLYKQ